MPTSALTDADVAVRVLREAAELIREDPIRKGSLLEFGAAGQLVMTGDMHGNLRNFDKLQRYCNLERSPARYVILHELIHMELERREDRDTSIDLLVRAAQWKCDFPDNVFFLQSNHELAQLRKQEITKGGRSVIHDFEDGVATRYGVRTPQVLEAVDEYIAALPLAAKTRNGVFMAHSLPDPLTLRDYDVSVFAREPEDHEYIPGGPAYSLVWGRFHTSDEIERFAQRLGVEVFVIGHTPQEDGFTRTGKLVIVSSDHNHGVFLPFDLGKQYTAEQLVENIRKFVSVA